MWQKNIIRKVFIILTLKTKKIECRNNVHYQKQYTYLFYGTLKEMRFSYNIKKLV